MNLPLKERLLKAASLVGPYHVDIAPGETAGRYARKTVVADVGCDHAYLSIYLVQEGKCDFAIASDVRQGPLQAAADNLVRYACQDKVVTLLTDGLHGIEPYSPSDIVICGMGGETIIGILNDAPWVRTTGMRLILQPQSAPAELAIYLAAWGFRIVKERYALDAGKPYRMFLFEYDGTARELCLEDALIGKLHYEDDLVAYLAYLDKLYRTIEKKLLAARYHNPHNKVPEALLTLVRKTIEEYAKP